MREDAGPKDDTEWLSIDWATLKSGRPLKYKAQGPLYAASFALSSQVSAQNSSHESAQNKPRQETRADRQTFALQGKASAKIPFKNWSVDLNSKIELNSNEQFQAYKYTESSDLESLNNSWTLEVGQTLQVLDPNVLLWGIGYLLRETKHTYYAQLVVGRKYRLLKFNKSGTPVTHEATYIVAILSIATPVTSIEEMKAMNWMNAPNFEITFDTAKGVISSFNYRMSGLGRIEMRLDES